MREARSVAERVAPSVPNHQSPDIRIGHGPILGWRERGTIIRMTEGASDEPVPVTGHRRLRSELFVMAGPHSLVDQDVTLSR